MGKRFGKEVGEVVGGADLFKEDRPGFDEFTEVVVTNIDVFHSFVVFVSAIAPLLLPLMTPGNLCVIAILSSQECIQDICCAHREIATYSASTVESATVA